MSDSLPPCSTLRWAICHLSEDSDVFVFCRNHHSRLPKLFEMLQDLAHGDDDELYNWISDKASQGCDDPKWNAFFFVRTSEDEKKGVWDGLKLDTPSFDGNPEVETKAIEYINDIYREIRVMLGLRFFC
ncbi:hypothetical protein [Mollivirus kamchatka]|nr:hypothetical protein [Mollivirus kamchatka]